MKAFDPSHSSGAALAVAVICCFFAGGLYGWSALAAPLQVTFGISTADTGLAFSLAIVSFTLAVIFTPVFFANRVSTRHIAGLAVIGAICAFMAVHAASFGMFLFWFSAGFGAMSGGLYSTTLAIGAASTNRTVATPVIVASFGAGGAVFGPLWRILDAANWGLHGLYFLAAGLTLSGILGWLINHTICTRSASSGDMQARADAEPSQQRRLALLWLIFAFGSYGGLMVLGMASKMIDANGISIWLASLTLSGIAICNTAGRLSVAALCPRLGLAVCLSLSVVLTTSGLVLIYAGGVVAILISPGLMLIAGGYGLVASTIPLLTCASFTPDTFQRRFGIVFTAWGTAGFSAPWIAGTLFDMTGSFDLALLSAILATGAFAVIGRSLVREIEQSIDDRTSLQPPRV
ncbi:hypothetical protein [uncultured Tateyamaria sp.]|uniref:hypothetical protein n=1 Tax=uncultured Tateyamaria sp. TaxID=455651 RepID=UPI00261450D6|nr:hypothetical protein [uncultured Tateyamaria sp.]